MLCFQIKPVEKQSWADFENLFLSKSAPSYCWCMADRIAKEEPLGAFIIIKHFGDEA
jgi:hypothetical protein